MISNGCTTPSNTAELIFDSNTVGTELERTTFPVGECSCGNMTRYYWRPILSNETNLLNDAYDNRR